MPKPSSLNGRYQLNVWISEEARVHLAVRKQEGVDHTTLIETLIRQDMAQSAGEQVERQSLPVIHESIDTTMRKYLAQLRTDLREDMHMDIVEAMKTTARTSENRLAKLIVRVMRDSGITRRLVFALMSKAHGTEFAHEAYEHAKAAAGQELAARSTARQEVEPLPKEAQ